MSDIESRKSKTRKTQGWEEAGGEFYQENYNAEWDVFPKDKITTLLPSVKNRMGTYQRNQSRSTNIKMKKGWIQFSPSDQTTYKPNDVLFELLPDLSQVNTDEERIWEEMLQIKLLPMSMKHKKEFKSTLQNATKLRLQGINNLKWKQRKIWKKICFKWCELTGKMELWQSSLRQVEGHFGTGVVAYFRFIRWLFVLNVLTFTLILFFIIIPNIYLSQCNRQFNETNITTLDALDTTMGAQDVFESFPETIIQILRKNGLFENSLLFYGTYRSNNVHENDESKSNSYNLPLAYITTTLVYFIFTLLAIVRATAREFKDPLINGKWQFYQYCNVIFAGWDYCIHNKKSSKIKHNALYSEIKNLLQSMHIEYEKSHRSRNVFYRLLFIRTIVNFLIAIILLISAYILYYLLGISLQQQKAFSTTEDSSLNSTFSDYETFEANNEMDNKLRDICIEYLPYIVMVFLNMVVPLIFSYLCQFEKYSPFFVMKISLFRTVFLRLASLSILLSRFYYVVIPQYQKNNHNGHEFDCWETFVGVQFVKLLITDFISHIFVTFCINFPRAVCAKKLRLSIFKFIGEQEFELPKHVLDIIYSQTICWLGSFYSPFVPLLVSGIIFCMFYVKKFQCLCNSKPSKLFYGVSRSNSLFMLVLLISFFVAIVPITFAIAEIKPSVNCGPFKGLNSVWETSLSAFMSMPLIFKNFIFFFGSTTFSIPCFFVLLLCLYYFHAVSDANKNMVNILKKQLALEGHDKQFLLNRLSIFLNQYQDRQQTSLRFRENTE